MKEIAENLGEKRRGSSGERGRRVKKFLINFLEELMRKKKTRHGSYLIPPKSKLA